MRTGEAFKPRTHLHFGVINRFTHSVPERDFTSLSIQRYFVHYSKMPPRKHHDMNVDSGDEYMSDGDDDDYSTSKAKKGKGKAVDKKTVGKGKGKGKSGDVSMSGANILVDAHGLSRHMLGRLRIPAHGIPCKKMKQEVYRVW